MSNTYYTLLLTMLILSLFSACSERSDVEPDFERNKVFNFGLEIRTYPFGYVSDTARAVVNHQGRIVGYRHTVLLTTSDVGQDFELSGMTQAIALRIKTVTPEFPNSLRADLVNPLSQNGTPRFVCEIHDDLDLDLLTTRRSTALIGGLVRMTTNAEGEVRISINSGSGLTGISGVWKGRLQPSVSEF